MAEMLNENDTAGEFYAAEWKIDKKCTPYQMHCHDNYEFFVIMHGNPQLFVNNTLYMLQPGQLVILPPFVMHGIIASNDPVRYERGSLYISPSSLRRAGLGLLDFVSHITDIVEEGYCFILSDAEVQTTKELFSHISSNLDDTTPLGRINCYADIVPFLNIVSHAQNTSKSTPRTHSDFTTEYKIISYIDQHFHEDLTVEKIAEHFNISTSTLMHIFNEYTNRSVYDYVLYRRIVKAKELISVGLPLSTVATSCGFNDYSNFLRIFKKRMGISPRAYQKQFSGNNEID